MEKWRNRDIYGPCIVWFELPQEGYSFKNTLNRAEFVTGVIKSFMKSRNFPE